jgi:hypothetical protein
VLVCTDEFLNNCNVKFNSKHTIWNSCYLECLYKQRVSDSLCISQKPFVHDRVWYTFEVIISCYKYYKPQSNYWVRIIYTELLMMYKEFNCCWSQNYMKHIIVNIKCTFSVRAGGTDVNHYAWEDTNVSTSLLCRTITQWNPLLTYQIITAVGMEITVFCATTPCSLVNHICLY